MNYQDTTWQVSDSVSAKNLCKSKDLQRFFGLWDPNLYQLTAVGQDRRSRSGKHARFVLHARRHFTQVMQTVAEGHFHLGQLFEVMADDVLIGHADTTM